MVTTEAQAEPAPGTRRSRAGQPSAEPRAALSSAAHACMPTVLTHKDAPASPAVVLLEPGQRVPKEAEALRGSSRAPPMGVAASARPPRVLRHCSTAKHRPAARCFPACNDSATCIPSQARRTRLLLRVCKGGAACLAWPGPGHTLTDTSTMRVMITPRIAAFDQWASRKSPTRFARSTARSPLPRDGCTRGWAGRATAQLQWPAKLG